MKKWRELSSNANDVSRGSGLLLYRIVIISSLVMRRANTHKDFGMHKDFLAMKLFCIGEPTDAMENIPGMKAELREAT